MNKGAKLGPRKDSLPDVLSKMGVGDRYYYPVSKLKVLSVTVAKLKLKDYHVTTRYMMTGTSTKTLAEVYRER